MTRAGRWLPWAGLGLVLHAALLLPLPPVWQAGAVWLWLGLLPGSLLVEAVVGRTVVPPLSGAERLLYSVGAGYAVLVAGMLILNTLPGSLSPLRVLLFFDLLLVALLLWLWWRAARASQPPLEFLPDLNSFTQPIRQLRTSSWLMAGLLVLVVVGSGLRLPNLGYAEFQGDEARPLLYAAAVVRGDGDAIYSHQKGPAEILIPAAIYAVAREMTEAAARLPFALASITGVLGVFVLGRRTFGPVAGWSAAMLLALDGYLIGFARIVQYQSLVFMTVVLCMLIFYRLLQTPRPQVNGAARLLTLAALILATGLLAHYEAGLVAIPGLYLLGAARLWTFDAQDDTGGTHGLRAGLGRLGRILAWPMLVGSALLALFYVPFVLHPTFESTYGYIAESRIGGEFPYNNLADFVRRTTLYSPIYYIGLLAVAGLVGLARLYVRNWGRVGWGMAGLLVLGLVGVFGQMPPFAPVATGLDLTWLLFAAAFGLAWLAPRQSHAARAVWIWLGALMVLMLFFIRTPNTHVYGFIIPWAVVAGMGAQQLWTWLVDRVRLPTAQGTGVAVAAVCLLIFGAYVFTYFVNSPRETLFNWHTARLPGYWVPYAEPVRGYFSSFGFPMRNGWKAIGVRYAQGQAVCVPGEPCAGLVAPFTTNDRQAVAEWYTRGAAYCPRDHRYYLLSHPVEPGEQANVAALRADLLAQGYGYAGGVTVNGRDKIEIYDRAGPAIREPVKTPLESVAATFDRTLSSPEFLTGGPAGVVRPSEPVNVRFGEHIRLLGYDLHRTGDDLGQALRLTLYWETDALLMLDYTVFNQVLRPDDFHKIGQRDGEPGCDLFPTTRWQPRVPVVDGYYIPLEIPLNPGALAETYVLLMGLYDRETGDRLPVFAANGDFLGDAYTLTELEISPTRAD